MLKKSVVATYLARQDLVSFRSVFTAGLFDGQTVIITGGGSGIGRCTGGENVYSVEESSLPLTPSGKIQKPALRERMRAGAR